VDCRIVHDLDLDSARVQLDTLGHTPTLSLSVRTATSASSHGRILFVLFLVTGALCFTVCSRNLRQFIENLVNAAGRLGHVTD